MKDLSQLEQATFATNVPLNICEIALENPRSDETVDAAKIEELADNIRENGLVTPLIGYEDEGRFFVTAGGRRLRALRLIHGADAEITVPGRLMPMKEAIEAGHYEQLTHERMSPTDELRIYANPLYAGTPDAELAAMTGRSTRYVKQRRAILEMPEEIVHSIWEGHLTVDQAAGLSYLSENEQALAEMYERAFDNPRLTGYDIRAEYTRHVRAWSKHEAAKFVTQEQYLGCGGKFQDDLFVDDQLVLNPEVLDRLARAAVSERVESDFTDAAFVREVDHDKLYDFKSHPGIDHPDLTEELESEYEDLPADWQVKAQMRDGKITESEGAALLERIDELGVLFSPYYPPELEAALGVVWSFSPYSEGGYRKRDHILPDDLEPLYAAGFLERPATKIDPETGEAQPVEEDEPLSEAMKGRIRKLATHAIRMELAKRPDEVLASYAAYLSFPSGYGYPAPFEERIDMNNHPEEVTPVTASKAWEAMLERAGDRGDEIKSLKPAEQRKALAYQLLMRLTVGYRGPVSSTEIRTYWTPDETFFKGYKLSHLSGMAEAIEVDGKNLLVELMTQLKKEPKKKDLVSALAQHAQRDADWLPFGF